MTPARLPTVHLPPAAGLLARWLRIAGFPVRLDAPAAPPLLSTDGTRWCRLRLEGEHVPAGAESMALPEGPWEDQLAGLARSLHLEFTDLRLQRLCAACGGELQFLPREDGAGRLPARAPGGLRHLTACDGCGRVSWPGQALEHRTRRLRQLFLEQVFRCGRCGQEEAPGGDRHLLRMELLTAAGPVELSEEDLEADPSAEIAALLRQIERQSEEELMDSVAYHREKHLCSPCRRVLLGLLAAFFRGDPRGGP